MNGVPRIDIVDARLRQEVERLREENRQLRQKVIARTEALLAAKEDVRVLDRMKRDFITLVAHELRTPLTAVVGMADLVIQGLYDDNEDLLSMIKTIGKEAGSLSRFVTDAIEFLQWISGSVELEKDTVDLRCQLVDVLAAVESGYQEKGLRVEIHGPEELALRFDRTSLSVCIERILDNAMKYSFPGGKILIHLSITPLGDGEEWVTVSVRDYGQGIDSEKLDYLYRALSLGYSSYNHTRGGGLSLAIVREIIWQHNGTIRVESAGPGEGCEAILGFPR